MKKIMFILFQVALFPVPWILRRLLLNLVPGFDINKSAKIGFSVVLADRTIMENDSFITHFTYVNNIDCLRMGSNSGIGKSNWITGANSSAKMFSDSQRKCELILGEHTRITGQHHIDCTGGIYIGKYTTVAGVRSQILSHSIDIKLSKQVAGPVIIGDYCFIGTSCIVLMHAKLPDYSVLGAGAVLNKSYDDTYKLYAGNPARKVKHLDESECMYFKRKEGHVA